MGQLRREVPGQHTLPQMDTFLGKSNSVCLEAMLSEGSRQSALIPKTAWPCPCSMWDVETFGERHTAEEGC